MSSIFNQEIPTDIFKYRSLEGKSRAWLQQTLLEDLLYFSTPDQFNDPFDCYPAYRPLAGRELDENLRPLVRRLFPELSRKQRLAKEGELRRTPPEEYQRRIDIARSAMNESSVYSLSEDPANILMWSHYGSSHRGICLHFDMDVLQRHFVPRGPMGLPVKYSHERPLIVVGLDTEAPRELLQKTFLVKADVWSYEREWRFLHYRGGAGLQRFPSEALKGVILGARISDQDADFLTSLAKERKEPLHLRRAVFDSRAFQLNVSA